MKQRSFLSILCFILLAFGVASVSAQTCIENRKYFTPNGTYDSNRRLILSSLPNNTASQDGFYYGSIGEEQDRVYALGMCIPRSTPSDCFNCIKGAAGWLIQDCVNQTDAYYWALDPTLCLVRYSNISFSGSAAFWEIEPQYLVLNTATIASDLTDFKNIWEDLTSRTITAASAARSTPSSSDNHYRVDFANLTKFQNIYALMQCTPDISSDECNNCLQRGVLEYQSCCGNNTGGYAFHNITLATPPKPPMNVPRPPSVGHGANTTDNDSRGVSAGIVVVITVPAVVIVLILVVLGFFICWRRKSLQRTEFESDSDVSTTNSLQYEFKTIEAATNKFSKSNKLGEGRFGEVYKGKFSNGTEVAVKRLSKVSGQDTKKFRNEAVLVSKIQHRNLARLLGFCLQGDGKFLIYEFVLNKSLDYFLFDPEKQGELDWTRRYKIIGGIAQGILHLHQDPQLTIIYRDFKASNILLDADMNPKISDFGMATVFGMEESRGNTNWIAETFVYMSPEYAVHGKFSMKSDVYSFGILILEIISGKKNSSLYQNDETTTAGNLVTYAWRLWRNGSQLKLLDSSIGRNYQSNEVTRCIHIALLCVQENPEDRPKLSTIVSMLTSNTISVPAPGIPGFFPQSRRELDPLSEGLESG
ncbi:serine/threonine kinase-like protein [Arabidopsis thaliana]|nr:serine/threonine kinase-like protein [Arabidopsis thaliana]CAB79285.1 serine/threonine kinase-like protein [Arabidopsis thaliana]